MKKQKKSKVELAKTPGFLVATGPGGQIVDGLPLPAEQGALEEMLRWSRVALAAFEEEGSEGLRRHHQRRMEDLFIAWSNELEELGEDRLVAGALELLSEQRRIVPALEHLTAGHDDELWARLDEGRGPGAARAAYERRWRVHRAFVAGAIGAPGDLAAAAG